MKENGSQGAKCVVYAITQGKVCGAREARVKQNEKAERDSSAQHKLP